MKKRALKEKRIRLLLGCLVVMGLALGVGYGLKARAQDSQIVKKNVEDKGEDQTATNTWLGTADMSINLITEENAKKGITTVNGGNSYQHFVRSYVYLGKETPLKFQVINSKWIEAGGQDVEDNLQTGNAILLDCMSVLGTSVYENNETTVVDQLNGSHFYTNYLTDTEKNAISKRTISGTDKSESISLPWDFGLSNNNDLQIYKELAKKDAAYWTRGYKFDNDGKITEETNPTGYIDEDGAYQSVASEKLKTTSSGISPSFLLDKKKILFSTKVDSEVKEEKEFKMTVGGKEENYYLYKNGAYKLTLIDDKLEAKVTQGKSVTISDDGKITIPYTITDTTKDDRTNYVSLLVTDGPWDNSKEGKESSIVSYQYESVEKNSGTVEFSWNSAWTENYNKGETDADKYYVYLIAEKQSQDFSTDAASEPYELTITKKLSSIDMTFYAPMRDRTDWKNGQYESIGSLFEDETSWDLKITGVNGESFSTDDPLESLLEESEIYIKDMTESQVDFNTPYTLAFGIKINNDEMSTENKYSFADTVTINLKIITSDDETEAKVKPIKIEVTNSGEVTVYNDKTTETVENSTSEVYFNFDFTTRKAKMLSVNSPVRSDEKELEYASKFDGIKNQLEAIKANIKVESVQDGEYKEATIDNVPIEWGGAEQDTFKENDIEGNTFVVWGEINTPKGKSYDTNGMYVYVTVKMNSKAKLKSPAIFREGLEKNIADSRTEIDGESTKVTITVPTGIESTGDDTQATIYYTLDGSAPEVGGDTTQEYNRENGIVLSEETYEALKSGDEVEITLNAKAVRDDWYDSAISTATIVFNEKSNVTVTDATIKGRTEEEPAEGQKEDTHIYKIRKGTEIALIPTDKSSDGKVFSRWNINGNKQHLPEEKDPTTGVATGAYTYTTDGEDTIKALYDTPGAPVISKGPEEVSVIDAKDGKDKPSASFSVTVTSPQEYQESLSYQWQKKAVGDADFKNLGESEATVKNDSETNTSTLTLKDIDYSQNGEEYRCLVTYTELDGESTKTAGVSTGVEESATLTVEKNGSKLSITENPTDVSIKEGQEASFKVLASPGYAEDKLTYQWQKAEKDSNEFSDIDGATEATYTVEGATEADSGTEYRCLVTEVDADGNKINWGEETGDGTAASKAATLTVTKEILYQVTVENGTLGDGVTTTKSYKAGTTVTIEASVPEGQRFVNWTCDNEKVKLKDADSASTSFEMPKFDNENTKITITANLADAYGIEITKQPENATVSAGKSATFSVEASSSYEMVYKWMADYHNGKGYQQVGTKSSYEVTKATKELSGTTFKCIISLKENPETTVTTQEVVLNVNEADYTVTVNGGTASPDSCKAGDTVTIKADDAEEGKVFKKWKVVKGDVNLNDATSAETSFIMPKADVELTAEYKEENGIQITSQPENVSTPEGKSVSFTVAASSSHELSYQWQEDKGDGNGFRNVGSNEASYSISAVSSSLSGARYRCIITAKDDKEVTITSNEALLTVTASTYTIKVNNGSGSATESVAGQVITVTANDAPEGQEFEKWVVVRGKANLADLSSKETTFTMPAANVELDVKYRNQIGAPSISNQPESATVYAGSSTNFKVEASGEELTYQWQLDKADGSGFQDISGATSATYRVYTEDCSMNGYKYRCLVNNRAGSATSNEATLTVTYKITQGAGASWQKNASNGLTFKGSGAYNKFKSVKVDGERLGGSNYTKSSDPTIITLSASYLQNLTNGTHTLTIVWDDGSAEAEFSIGGTAVSSSSSRSTTSSSSTGSNKSSSSSSGTNSKASDQTKTADSSNSKTTGTTDMPIVNKSKSSTGASSTKNTGTSSAENSKSSKVLGTGNVEKSSLLNRYAALISLIVVAGCGIGGAVVLGRKFLRGKDEEDMF